MTTNEEIRAKDLLPHKTSFSAGDGFYGDGPMSFFMEHQNVANNIVKDSANNPVATESDLVADSKLPVMTVNGPKALPGDVIAPKSVQDNLVEKTLKALSPYIYGDEQTNPAHLSEVPVNTVIVIQRTADTTIDDFPSDYTISSGFDNIGILTTTRNNIGEHGFVEYQILRRPTLHKTWFRYKSYATQQYNAWQSLHCVDEAELPKFLAVNENYIRANASTNPSDLNDLKENAVYLVQKTSATTTANFPSEFIAESSNVSILTVNKSYIESDSQRYLVVQTLESPKYNVQWTRRFSTASNTWTAWQSNAVVNVVSNYIALGNSTNPSDLNDLKENSLYIVQRSSATTTANFPSNFPTTSSNFSTLSILKSYSNEAKTAYLVLQVLDSPYRSERWVRRFSTASGTWSDWQYSYLGHEKTYTVGSAGDFTTLREAFEFAQNNENTSLRILPGTYDLTVEYADILHSITSHVGLPLGNGVHAFFCDGAKVVARFDNSEQTYTEEEWAEIVAHFNPFRAVGGDFVLENLNIDAENCRYCVHDDRSGSGTERHEYKNCHMIKRTTTPDNKYMDCIGGGFGKHSTIVIDGGDYQSITEYGIDEVDNGDPTSAQRCISFHGNGTSGDEQSSVEIKNVYLHDRGWFSIKSNGTSTLMSKFLISGCSTGLPILEMWSSGGTVDNCECVEWNNAVRNSGAWIVADNHKSATLQE